MRTHRTPEEWHILFDQQQRSGLNKTQFCRQHGITRSAFSNARHRLSASSQPTAFVPALPPDSTTDKNAASDTQADHSQGLREAVKLAPQTERQLALMLPGATLSLPADISPRWLATLLREMAP
jgi:hypothetical protein